MSSAGGRTFGIAGSGELSALRSPLPAIRYPLPAIRCVVRLRAEVVARDVPAREAQVGPVDARVEVVVPGAAGAVLPGVDVRVDDLRARVRRDDRLERD